MKKKPVGFFVTLEPTFQNRAQLIAFLELVRQRLCVYIGSRCDCKYGADHVGKGHESGNGCPEMRVLMAMVASMTDAEFERLKRRLH